MPSKSYTREMPAVVVSYNTKDLLRECLQSVHREATGLNTETLQYLARRQRFQGRFSADGQDAISPIETIRSTISIFSGATHNLALETSACIGASAI
jgi:hypothetical protein